MSPTREIPCASKSVLRHELRSRLPALSFSEAASFFAAHDRPFGVEETRVLLGSAGCGETDSAGLLLSDQCPHTVHLAFFEKEAARPYKVRQFVGSLLRQLDELCIVLKSLNGPGEDGEQYRVPQRDYPEEAVREALHNLLAHRRYDISSFAKISVYPNRLEFLSLGGLSHGLELEDVQRGVSVPQNTALFSLLRDLGYVQGLGLGLGEIQRSYVNFAAKPQFKATQHTFTLLLPNRNHRLEAQPAQLIREYSALDQYERELFERLSSKERFSRKDVEEALHVSSATAIKVLKDLVDKGLIISIGAGKNTRYYFDPEAVWPRWSS